MKMSAFQQQYKGRPFTFGNPRENRFIRVAKHEESRKKHRTKIINENRNILNSPCNTPQKEEVQTPKVESRMARLLKWRAERDKRKKVEQMKKKRPFVVGVVHHKLYSPITKDEAAVSAVQHEKVCKPIVSAAAAAFPKRITRATEKRLMNKTCARKPTKVLMKNLNPAVNKEQKNRKKQEQSIAPANYKFEPPAGLPQVLLFGRVAPQSMSPLRFSELVSSSRMRRASRKSNNMRFSGLLLNNKEHNVSLVNKKKDTDNAKESSIESVKLKLSFNEDEECNSFSSNNKNDDIITKSDSKAEKINKKVINNNAVEAFPSPSNNTSITEPVFFSPYVVSSRGKSNARKEQQLRRGFSIGRSPGDDIPTKDIVMNLNISIEEEERTAQYFQFLLNREIKRLNELCEKWTEIKDDPNITEDAQYLINQAIGQTNLLISKKFQRFRSLVSDCETGKGEMLVTRKDLQGFWDMMHIEINNCDTRFEKLEKLRSQGWEEEEPPVTKPLGKKKATTRKKVVSRKPSSIRDFLKEKKKKMAQETKNEDDTGELNIINSEISNNKFEKIESSSSVKYRTRSTSGGLDNKSITPSKHGRVKSTLLPKVQLSETATMRLDNSISCVNLDQTPRKSILKQSKKLTKENSSMKSTHTVNFDDHVCLNEVPIDEELQTKIDLAAALARIDHLDLDSLNEKVPMNTAKQLTFSDNSFEETEDVHDTKEHSELKNSVDNNTSKISSVQVQAVSPSQSTSSLRRCLRRHDAVDESNEKTDETSLLNITTSMPVKKIKDNAKLNVLKLEFEKFASIKEDEGTNEQNDNIRVLRNRSIMPINTPIHKRRSLKRISMDVKESEQKENKTPLKGRGRSSLGDSVKDNKNPKTDLDSAMNSMSLTENSDKRRHSRRSVKFSEKECSGCVENKQVLPMTPHIRRSKLQSSEKKRRSKITHDLISWETPEKPPARVRRSHSKRVSSLI